MQCPLCSFEDEDEYALGLHVETIHFAEESPFLVKDTPDAVHHVDAARLPRQSSANNETWQDEEGARYRSASCQWQSTVMVDTTSSDDDTYLPCPEEGCGEHVLWNDLQTHLDFHLAESIDIDNDGDASAMYEHYSFSFDVLPSYPQALSYQAFDIHTHQSPPSGDSNPEEDPAGLTSERTALGRRYDPHYPSQDGARRLGKRELGPYAFEKEMPAEVKRTLQKGGRSNQTQRLTSSGEMYTSFSIENEIRGTVDVLSSLLERDGGVAEAYLCDPRVQHVFKLPREGAFCGYRNCQMMLSFILNAQWPGYESIVAALGGNPKASQQPIPNVFELQHLIEQAWDAGFNSRCRTETGGILNTRKYIGTPECQSLLALLQIPTTFNHIHDVFFSDEADPRNGYAYKHLFDTVETYFRSHDSNVQDPSRSTNQIHTTRAPPIYFQQPGHSMTIIGLEKRENGLRNLLVLDPGFGPSKGIRTLLERQEASSDAPGPSRPPRSAPAASSQKSYPSSSSTALYRNPTDGKLDGWVRTKNPPHPTSQRCGDHASYSSQSLFSRRGKQGGAGGGSDSENARKLLEGYRRGGKQLKRHREFEVLMLAPMGGTKER